MNFPPDLKYTDHDEWIRVEDDVLTIGISDYAQDALGELVHVELPVVGKRVVAGDVLCEVESVKAVAEVFTPVDGEVVEVNEALDDEEANINDDPYGEGWLVKIRADSLDPLDGLMDAKAYEQKIEDA